MILFLIAGGCLPIFPSFLDSHLLTYIPRSSIAKPRQAEFTNRVVAPRFARLAPARTTSNSDFAIADLSGLLRKGHR
jgi:hypothetical protein